MAASALAVIFTYPSESPRSHDGSVLQQAVALAEGDSSSTGSSLTSNPNVNPSLWTIMVYVGADDGSLEEEAISDFMEMAEIGSNEEVNIVVQLDRIPEEDDSYDDWTECRRFLMTEGLTPSNGNEVMNIGEVDMSDPDTLVDFVEWAAYNYPAEQYALIISSHGKGWLGCCWDETSGNNNMNLQEMRSALGDIYTLIGKPLDILGFDACLMSMTEVAYELDAYASIMVASENAEPSSGWPYNTILSQLVENPEISAKEFATIIVDSYYNAHAPSSYTMAAIDMTRIEAMVATMNELAQALVVYADSDHEAIRNYAASTMAAIEATVICEKHGTRWPGSHGLAIYFPAEQSDFDQSYNAGAVSLADDTAWEEFLIGSFTYDSDNWIAAARADTQHYYCAEHVDLYDFCNELLGN